MADSSVVPSTLQVPVELTGGGRSSGSYDGVDASALAERLGLPAVVARDVTGSTLDDAHRLAAAGAPGGTLLLADRQTAGRGRLGRAWASAAGQGIWLTMIARAAHPDAVGVLSLRLGLHLAARLDGPAGGMVRLKWPNDLYVASGKLAGVLVEARWQGAALAWLAVGVGLNVRPPAGVGAAAGLPAGVTRLALLDVVVPAIVDALGTPGTLGERELAEFARRDLAAGRRAIEPLEGTVLGIAADGALRVRTRDGDRLAHAGSLVLHPPLTAAGSTTDVPR